MTEANDGRFDKSRPKTLDDLKLENELLKLKMQAELGAHFGEFPGSPELSPVVERQFLEHVLEFERLHAGLELVPVRQYLGNPVFPPSAELDPEALERQWERLQQLYGEKELFVEFAAEYPVATKYDFMAGEMLDQELEPIPGWVFIYEEFHPNHDYDQRHRTQDFMQEFFLGRLRPDTVSPQILNGAGEPFDLEQVQALLERFHGMFAGIDSWAFGIDATSAQGDAELEGLPPGAPRLGFTEGAVRYTVRTGDGESHQIEGPFKLWMECNYGWWSVLGFEIWGFEWR